MKAENNLILVGVISGAHGIKGNVVVKSHTKPASNLAKLEILNSNAEPLGLKKIKENSKGDLICRLENCPDRNKAEELKGTKLYCQRDNLPSTKADEFYFEDLKGLEVRNKAGKKIGIVAGVANYGAGDIIEIKFEDGKEEMFPFTKEFFPEVGKGYVVFEG